MNTSQKIERTNRLTASERMAGPKKINAAQTINGGGLRWAFCKTAAGVGDTLTCFLGTDTTGPEITVNFTLLNCSNLSDGHLSFVIGTPIPVMRRDGDWWCIIPIEGTGDC